MPDSSPVRELLEQLKAAWQSMNAPIVDLLAPGAPDERLDAAERTLGFPIPDPLREWWAWHDGLQPTYQGASSMEVWLGARAWRFLSLDEAIDRTEKSRQVAFDVTSSSDAVWDAQQLWHDSWLGLSEDTGGYVIAVDCASSDAPVRHIDWEDPLDHQEPHLEGFAELLEAWIHFLQTGVWRWDGTRWVHNQEKWSELPRHTKPFA